VNQIQEILDMDEARGIVQGTRAERESGVTGGDRFLEFRFERFFGVKEDDLAARGHDVADDEVLEIERIDGELLA
jgi:hypothetical protein